MIAVSFWICVIGIIMPYAIYPVWLYLLSRFRAEENRTNTGIGVASPDVTFVISAYNEADVIAEKIENTLSIEYDQDRLQIIVISDESDDGTDEIVCRYPQVELLRQEPRLGKSAGITASFGRFRGEVIVFSDANAIYQSDAVNHLVRHFDDDTVGYVVGRQTYYDGTGRAQRSENTYWDYELKLKSWESRLSSVVGGDGAIMAIRRELFSPLQPDDINDFVLPLRIITEGFRGRFEPDAVCFEEAAPSFKGEFRRKVRIVSRSLRAVVRVPQALNPFRVGIFAMQLFCHKVIRWFAAYLMLGAMVSSGSLAFTGSAFYGWLFAMQSGFYLIAVVARWTLLGRIRLATLIYYFCMANVAGGLGVLNCLLGKKISTWTPQREVVSETEQTA